MYIAYLVFLNCKYQEMNSGVSDRLQCLCSMKRTALTICVHVRVLGYKWLHALTLWHEYTTHVCVDCTNLFACFWRGKYNYEGGVLTVCCDGCVLYWRASQPPQQWGLKSPSTCGWMQHRHSLTPEWICFAPKRCFCDTAEYDDVNLT